MDCRAAGLHVLAVHHPFSHRRLVRVLPLLHAAAQPVPERVEQLHFLPQHYRRPPASRVLFRMRFVADEHQRNAVAQHADAHRLHREERAGLGSLAHRLHLQSAHGRAVPAQPARRDLLPRAFRLQRGLLGRPGAHRPDSRSLQLPVFAAPVGHARGLLLLRLLRRQYELGLHVQ